MRFWRALAFTCFGLCMVSPWRAHGDDLPCKNLVIHMSDESGESRRSDSDFSEEGTAVFVCNGSELEVRDQVSIHMIATNSNGLCYTDFSCGNLNLWGGSFVVGARTMNATFEEFLCSGAWRSLGINSPHISVDASFNFLNVRRHCTAISKPVCVGAK